MRVLRGRVDGPEADDAVAGRLVSRVARTGDPALRVWRPDRHLSFGRRDVRSGGYRRAREAAIERGFPPVERRTGGRAAAVTRSTVTFALVEPTGGGRSGIRDRYEDAAGAVQRALWRLGVPAQRGEPPEAFCPGNHALRWTGKIAGFAQRVEGDAALLGGIVIVSGHERIAEVLEPVYAALGVPFDPDTVSSIERAGGRADPGEAAREIEAALLGDRDADVERVGEPGSGRPP